MGNSQFSASADIVKFFMAICVVTIHSGLGNYIEPEMLNNIALVIRCCAVPFFFICSSYFVLKKHKAQIQDINSKDGLKDFNVTLCSYLKRMGLLYLFWASLNFICFDLIYNEFSKDSIIRFIYNFIFMGYDVFWYVWGCIMFMPILFLMIRFKIKPIIYLILGFSLFVFNRAFTHFGHIDNDSLFFYLMHFFYSLNKSIGITNFCSAGTYLSIGAFFVNLKKFPNILISITLIIIGFLMAIFESHKDVAFGIPLIAVGLFPLVLNLNWNIPKSVSLSLRHMSAIIYFIHIIVIALVFKYLQNLCHTRFTTWIILVALCVLFSYIFLKISKFKRFSFLKNFY